MHDFEENVSGAIKKILEQQDFKVEKPYIQDFGYEKIRKDIEKLYKRDDDYEKIRRSIEKLYKRKEYGTVTVLPKIFDKNGSSKFDEIREKVQQIVMTQLGVNRDQITWNARFVEDLNADSLDQVELIMALEEEFASDIPDEDAENLKTVGDAIWYIMERKGLL